MAEIIKNNDAQGLQKAMEFMDQGLYLQAIWSLQESISQNPERIQPKFMLAHAFFQNDQPDEAEAELKSLLTEHPEHTESLRLLSRIYISTNRGNQAVPVLKHYLRSKPYDPVALEELFFCYTQIEQFELAYKTYFDIPSEFLNDETTDCFIKVAYRLKKFNTVIQVYTQHLKRLLNQAKEDKKNLQPISSKQRLSHRTMAYYGLSHFNLGNKDQSHQAFLELKRAFVPDEDHIKAWKLIAEITKDARWSEFVLEAMVSTYPESKKAKLNLLEYHLQNNPSKCLELLDEAEEDTEILKIRGRALRHLEKYTESTELLEKMMLVDPNDDSLPFEVGLNWFEQGHHAKALKYFECYEKRSLKPEYLNYYLSACYFNTCRNELGKKHLLKSVENTKHHDDTWIFYLDILNAGHADDDLILFIDKAESMLENCAQGLRKLAHWFKNSNIKRAINLHEKALLDEPENDNSLLFLAIENLRMKQYSKSFEYFNQLKSDLEDEHLSMYCESAERSLNYSTAFHLYLKLCTTDERLELLKPRMHNLIQKRDSFHEIFRKWTVQDFEKYESILKHHPLLYYKAGLKYYNSGNLRRAASILSALDKTNPGFLKTRFFLGIIHLSKQELKDARVWLESYLKDEPQYQLQTLRILGELYFDEQMLDHAKACYIRLYQQSENKLDALEYLFQIYKTEGRLDRFVHLVTSNHRALVKINHVRIMLASAYMELKQYGKAINQYASIPSNSPYRQQSLYQAGRCYVLSNNHEQACEQFSLLESYDNRPAEWSYYYGVSLSKTGKHNAAKKWLHQSLELNECIQESLHQLNIIHNLLDEPKDAFDTLNQLMNIDFDFDRFSETISLGYKSKSYNSIVNSFEKNLDSTLSLAEHKQSQTLFQTFITSLYQTGKWDRAEECLAMILDYRPLFLRTFIKASPFPEDFRTRLLKAGLNLCQNDYLYAYLLGKSYLKYGNQDAAMHLLQNSLRTMERCKPSPEDKQSLHASLAAIYFGKNDYEPAKHHILKALEITQNDVKLLEKLSFLHHKLGEPDLQAQVDQKLFFINPKDSNVSYRLMNWFEKKGDIQNTIAHLKNYLKAYPDDHARIKKLASLASQAGMFNLELWAYDKLEKSSPNVDREHFLNKGNAFLSQNKEIKAAECFQKYLADNPDNVGLRFRLAQLYKQKGFLRKARMTLLELYRQESANSTVLYELCECLFEEKRLSECEHYLDILLDIKPYHKKANFLLARIHLASGGTKKAIIYVDKTLKIDPQDQDAQIMLAQLFKSEGLHQDSYAVYEELYRKTKKYEYLLELGMLNLKLKKKETALKQFKQLTEKTRKNSKLSRLAQHFLRKQRVA
jgi:tetratricopeptide (TPR) repeat protein